MIDVNKITSTLAKLPDQQLQQYAQMHKNDPYIMALAMSESNRRKEMRASGQGATQEQPKVVDQMVAEMAPQQMPEEMGIGQLPAGEMNFAGGGIIAFADGGDVERYSGEFGSLVEGLNPEFGFSPTYVPSTSPDPESMRRVASSPYTTPSAPPVSAESAALLQRFPKPESAPRAAPPREERAPVADRAPAAGGFASIDALQKKYFGDLDAQQAGFKTMRQGLVQGIKDLADTNLADVKGEIAARGDVYKGREERLSKQEKDLAGMGDRYLGLALLQAGAAMMSTPGGLAAAIGKGAVVGADRYASGLEKINAAQAKFAEARDRLDDLRINRDDMNAKDIRAALRDSKAADLRGQELLLSGAEKDWGIKRDVLGKVFTAANEDLQTTRRIQAQRDTAVKQDTNEKMRSSVFADLQRKFPNDPAKVAAEFNKAFSKTEDLDAYFKKQQLDKLADAKIKNASMGGVGVPGQAEQLAALERQLIGNQVKVASRADVAATAKSSGKTEQQVTEALRARGYTIQ
jgi:hypothetical protein